MIKNRDHKSTKDDHNWARLGKLIGVKHPSLNRDSQWSIIEEKINKENASNGELDMLNWKKMVQRLIAMQELNMKKGKNMEGEEDEGKAPQSFHDLEWVISHEDSPQENRSSWWESQWFYSRTQRRSYYSTHDLNLRKFNTSFILCSNEYISSIYMK